MAVGYFAYGKPLVSWSSGCKLVGKPVSWPEGNIFVIMGFHFLQRLQDLQSTGIMASMQIYAVSIYIHTHFGIIYIYIYMRMYMFIYTWPLL